VRARCVFILLRDPEEHADPAPLLLDPEARNGGRPVSQLLLLAGTIRQFWKSMVRSRMPRVPPEPKKIIEHS
jgi:hypothetical protein